MDDEWTEGEQSAFANYRAELGAARERLEQETALYTRRLKEAWERYEAELDEIAAPVALAA